MIVFGAPDFLRVHHLMRFIILILCGFLWIVIPMDALADFKATASEKENNGYDSLIRKNWCGLFSPGSDIYPRYIADPLRPTFSMARAWIINEEIPISGDERYIFRLGGRYGFLRIYPCGNEDAGFQLDLGGAFLGVFDIDNSLDNIGWDGIYEVLFSWGNGAGFAMQSGIKHDSSHVGDEYNMRTGRTRIDYTRGEYVLGLSLAGIGSWRIYAESGYAYDMRNSLLQDRWRLQWGIEVEDDRRFFKGHCGYFAAANFTSYEESDWKLDTTVLTGLLFPIKDLARNYRFALQYRDGRSIIGELFQFRERYISIGFWLDL